MSTEPAVRRSLRVLLTNHGLVNRAGTELWVKEVAIGLLARGHRPVVFAPELGAVADEIREAGIPVTDDLATLGEAPDLVHGHHQQLALAALLRFPGVPGLFVVHDWTAWHDAPPRFPRLHRYAAVDVLNRERLVSEGGIAPERVRLLLNWVDLERFARRPALPAKPRRALLFSNYATSEVQLPVVAAACRRAGIELDTVGLGVGRPVEHPEAVLGQYDLVFAIARSAIEALATGAAVILCDTTRGGPLVTAGDVATLRDANFGRRVLRRPLSVEGLATEIARYDAIDAGRVTDWVRERAGFDVAMAALLELYDEVLAAAGALPADPRQEIAAMAEYLDTWWRWQPHLRSRCHELEGEVTRLEALVARQQDVLDAMHTTRTWRLRNALARLRPGR